VSGGTLRHPHAFPGGKQLLGERVTDLPCSEHDVQLNVHSPMPYPLAVIGLAVLMASADGDGYPTIPGDVSVSEQRLSAVAQRAFERR
jgi:hypothetical protein